jgi:hypothetical protein
MQPINAISLAPAALGWLANSHHPRLLHVFEQACNLINERGEVLSIVITQIGNGPFNLVLEEEVLFSDHLDEQSPISIHADHLHLDDLTINIADTKLWQPRPDWEALHARRDRILDQLMSLSLPDHQLSIPDTLAYNLTSALASEDISTVKTIASHIAGLGIGLTPTGDDFIMGAVYAVWIIHSLESASLLAEEIAITAAPLTTSLSAAWLRSAGRGEAGTLWHVFFDTLLSADSESTQYTIDKILAVGETSGFDSMLGFANTFLCWQEMKSS